MIVNLFYFLSLWGGFFSSFVFDIFLHGILFFISNFNFPSSLLHWSWSPVASQKLLSPDNNLRMKIKSIFFQSVSNFMILMFLFSSFYKFFHQLVATFIEAVHPATDPLFSVSHLERNWRSTVYQYFSASSSKFLALFEQIRRYYNCSGFSHFWLKLSRDRYLLSFFIRNKVSFALCHEFFNFLWNENHCFSQKKKSALWKICQALFYNQPIQYFLKIDLFF